MRGIEKPIGDHCGKTNYANYARIKEKSGVAYKK